jgi:tetratricopeptide (TPR) repeat protein
MKTIKDQAIQYMKEKRYADAIPLLLQLKKEEIKDWTLYYTVGQCCRFSGDLASAYQFLETAKQINRLNAEIVYAFGEVCQLRLKYEDAIRAYEDVITLEPNRIAAYNKIGLLYARMNKTEEAMKWFQRGMKQVSVLENVGIDMNDDVGRQHLKSKMELGFAFPCTKPEDTMDLQLIKAILISNMGVCYLEKEEKDKARELFESSLSILPKGSIYNELETYIEEVEEADKCYKEEV